jgi:hypothetical protein
MSAPNRPARLNRSLLAVIGVLLLAGGAFVLLTGLGVLHVRPAAAALVTTSAQPLDWVPYIATVAAIVLGLLCLRWLAAQGLRRPKTGTWHLARDRDHGDTRLSAAIATDPLVTDIEGYPGVSGASASLTGGRANPRLYVTVAADPEVDLGSLRGQIAEHAVGRLRQALELDHLPAQIQFQLTGSRVR